MSIGSSEEIAFQMTIEEEPPESTDPSRGLLPDSLRSNIHTLHGLYGAVQLKMQEDSEFLERVETYLGWVESEVTETGHLAPAVANRIRERFTADLETKGVIEQVRTDIDYFARGGDFPIHLVTVSRENPTDLLATGLAPLAIVGLTIANGTTIAHERVDGRRKYRLRHSDDGETDAIPAVAIETGLTKAGL